MRSLIATAVMAAALKQPARFATLEVPPKDAILGVKEEFLADPAPAADKINLSVGAYRTDEGEPWVLPPIAAARRRLVETMEHEYLASTGDAGYCAHAARLLYGSPGDEIATVQSLSGTGSLRLCFEFLKRHYPDETVYGPSCTWANHWNILRDAGMNVEKYAYLDAAGLRLDWPALYADLEQAPDGSIVLLHLCAHNPSGNDPTRDQWKELAALAKRKNFLPLFDSAYLGFASGDVDADAWPFRHFVDEGLAPWACVSFSKNFGLYSERAGAVHATCADAAEAAAVKANLGTLARALYSNPPAFGARLVAEVLGDDDLEKDWRQCLVTMSGRIAEMREALRAALEARVPDRDWSHITSQIGMFSYTGLSAPQVMKLRADYHVYMLESGRLSMAGVTKGNVEPLADAIQAVLKEE
mmetsp:Transcript_33997/g.105211  ORF Transcript_33997/g.105211 Transcript_33997/m.105211 type:complete len:415 (-) Transcript_33997:30-1274(-)